VVKEEMVEEELVENYWRLILGSILEGGLSFVYMVLLRCGFDLRTDQLCSVDLSVKMIGILGLCWRSNEHISHSKICGRLSTHHFFVSFLLLVFLHFLQSLYPNIALSTPILAQTTFLSLLSYALDGTIIIKRFTVIASFQTKKVSFLIIF